MNKLLNIKNVNLSFKNPEIMILEDVSLFVEAQKITVILGESGAGKSMLIKCIINLINRKNMNLSGECLLEDKDLFMLKGKKRRALCSEIALVMQNPMTSFNPSKKIGIQMIDILCATEKGSKKEAKTRAILALEKLNLPTPASILTAYPSELSGGMLQRIMISLALMSKAKVIIADEPTTALDVLNQKLVIDEILRLKDMGIGVILVTHDISIARKTGDFIAVMKKGKVVEFGVSDEVLNYPKHEYTKALINASLFRMEEENDID